MEIINRLQKLPINKGRYLVLPNTKKPLFIIPITSKWAYKKAISLIKPKNVLGNLKKTVLAEIPFFILKRVFTTIVLETTTQNKYAGQLVLPWNQDSNNKFTIFNFEKEQITLLKIGFNNAIRLIDNEYKCIMLLSEMGTDIIPEIKSYSKHENQSILETKFYSGYHPKTFPLKITTFFEQLYNNAEKIPFKDHPYILKIKDLVLNTFVERKDQIMIEFIKNFSNKFKNKLIPLVIMHGDCSMTNIIKSGEKCYIIDWEEGIMEGAPVDLAYFEFRRKIDTGQNWPVKNAIDFLVVLHYLYFQIKHGNIDLLNRVEWKDNEIGIRL